MISVFNFCFFLFYFYHNDKICSFKKIERCQSKTKAKQTNKKPVLYLFIYFSLTMVIKNSKEDNNQLDLDVFLTFFCYKFADKISTLEL